MDIDSKGRVRGQGLVQDDVILGPFPIFVLSMSYFLLLLVVLLQFFLAACVFYLALSLGDFACVVLCTLLCSMFALCTGGGLRMTSIFAMDPLMFLDSLSWSLPDLRVFSFFVVCPRPGHIVTLGLALTFRL